MNTMKQIIFIVCLPLIVDYKQSLNGCSLLKTLSNAVFSPYLLVFQGLLSSFNQLINTYSVPRVCPEHFAMGLSSIVFIHSMFSKEYCGHFLLSKPEAEIYFSV